LISMPNPGTRQQLFDIRLGCSRRSLGVGGEWLTDLEEHLLETSRGDGNKHPCRFVACIPETMQASDRHVGECACACHKALFAGLEGDFALENVTTLLIRPPATPDPCSARDGSRRIVIPCDVAGCNTGAQLTWRAARRMFNIG
jgi:hypothetical protein